MADEDKEKAEKIAAAKKRFEELKKQKAKEGDKGSGTDSKPKKKGGKKKAASKDAKDKDNEKDKKEDDEVDDNEEDDNATADEATASKVTGESSASTEALEKDNQRLKKELEESKQRVKDLEKRIKLSEEKERASQSQISDLQSKAEKSSSLRPGARKSVDGDSGGLEELEDEERRQLQARVQELESEVYELRKGVWRDPKSQGDADGDNTAPRSPGAFSDVDLTQGPYSTRSRRQSSGVGQAFGFQNVLNAFTGPPGVTPGAQHRRGQSKGDGLLEDDDDMEFDEEAFRKAQEEEAKARLERVKEVKRGLSGWKGWRVDLVELRGGAETGVFDV